MSDSSSVSLSTRFKVGTFTILGLLAIGVISIFVNHKPYWWRPCQSVRISVEDATGLKTKSPIRSLGLEIGYLQSVELAETHVTLGICITANVEVLPSTRAYIRSEGFLGDKFVELRPVKYLGSPTVPGDRPSPSFSGRSAGFLWNWIEAEALAETPDDGGEDANRKKPAREIPVAEGSQDMQHVVTRVGDLVNEMTKLTNSLKQAINPEELRETMRQLNHTLENASRTLSPESGLNQTARRSLGKLEDAIDQLRDQVTRINQGKGSMGMLLNDPTYAEDIRKLLDNANKLLNRVGTVTFVLDVGGQEINGYNSGRGYFKLHIFPEPDRYYLIGADVDPRGKRTFVTTTTTAGGTSQVTTTESIDQTGLQFTAMIGKILFNRLDLSIGALDGDGDITVGFYLGWHGAEDRIILWDDLYSHGGSIGINDRVTLQVQPFFGIMKNIYLDVGVESFQQVNGYTPYFYGAGIAFSDDDIKLLFTLK